MLTALLPFELCFFTLSQPAFLALIFSATETSASIPHAAVPTEISLRTRGTGHAAQISWGFFHKSIWAYKPFGKRWAGYPKKNLRDIGKILCPSQPQPTNQIPHGRLSVKLLCRSDLEPKKPLRWERKHFEQPRPETGCFSKVTVSWAT